MKIYLISGKQRFFLMVSILSLIVLSTGILLAGCIEPGYQPDHDVLVIKLSSNGSLEWSKVIDKGGNDDAGLVIPTEDNGSIILMNFYDFIRFSKDGSTVWEKIYMDPRCTGETQYRLRDGSFVIAASGSGEVCRIDKNGILVWNKSSVKFDDMRTARIHSIIETKDGGFLVAGNYLTKLNSEGEPIWQYSYDTHDGIPGYQEIFSVVETKNGEFLGLARKYNESFLLGFDENGIIIANSSLGSFSQYPSDLTTIDKGYALLYFNTTSSIVEKIGMSPDGNVIQKKTLFNVTIPDNFLQKPTIMTSDGGYASVVFRYSDSRPENPSGSRKISIGIKKMDTNGVEMWTETPVTFCKPEYTTNIKIKRVAQTSDDGYLILGMRDNFWKC